MSELHTRRNGDYEVDEVTIEVTLNEMEALFGEETLVEFFFDRPDDNKGDDIAHHNLRLTLNEAWALWSALGEQVRLASRREDNPLHALREASDE